MGLGRAGLRTLLRESARRPFGGSIVTLGRQSIYFTNNHVVKIAAQEGAQLTLPHNRFESGRIPSDPDVFAMLGFDRYETLDYSDYENATVIADLNLEGLPAEARGAFDVVLDSGTMEHVFHVPNVFKNIHELLAPGGRIIHMAPSSSHIDHGFYMYSPTLFWDFYETNRYELNAVRIFRYRPNDENGPWMVSEYTPGCLEGVLTAPWDGARYGVICIATKQPEARADLIPQQHFYRRTWPVMAEGVTTRSGPARVLARKLGRYPAMRPWARKAVALRGAIRRYPLTLPTERY
jgi:SAM-dependent methyltransferase